MKTTNKAAAAYPALIDQPSYREASNKLSHFRTQLQAEKEKLHSLQVEHSKSINPDETPTAESDRAIQKAEALIAGTAPLQSLVDQIQTKTRLIVALEAAAKAQSTIVDEVARTLSREAGQHFIAEHKAVVCRLITAVQELHAANLAEVEFRNALERQGYHGALPAMLFGQVPELDPANHMGCRAFYWMPDAKAYIA